MGESKGKKYPKIYNNILDGYAAQIKILSQTALKYLKFSIARIDYQMLADDLLNLTGAEFTVIDTYNPVDNSVTLRAIAGDISEIEKAEKIIGNLVGNIWKIKNFSTWISKSKRLAKAAGFHELFFQDTPTPKNQRYHRTKTSGRADSVFK